MNTDETQICRAEILFPRPAQARRGLGRGDLNETRHLTPALSPVSRRRGRQKARHICRNPHQNKFKLQRSGIFVGMNVYVRPHFNPLSQERKSLSTVSGFADECPANSVVKMLKGAANDSPSPGGEGRGEGGCHLAAK